MTRTIIIVCKFSVVDVWADARDLVPEEADQEDAVQGLQAGPREEHQEELIETVNIL